MLQAICYNKIYEANTESSDKNMEGIRGKHVELSVVNEDELYRFVHVLASPVRIRIIKTLGERSTNVGELAQKLDIPMSSAVQLSRFWKKRD